MSDEFTPCYIARCLCGCGALVFASVDAPGQPEERRNDTAAELADLVRGGYTIDRMNVGEVRAAKFGCASAQLALL